MFREGHSATTPPGRDHRSPEWELALRCTVFNVLEKVSHPGTRLTLVFDDDGELFLRLPGHGLARDLVQAAVLAVIRAEDRAQNAIEEMGQPRPQIREDLIAKARACADYDRQVD